jgi:hypothetical protein
MSTTWLDLKLGGVRRSTPNGPEAINQVTRELNKLRSTRIRNHKASCQCPYHVSDDGFSRTLSVNLNPNRINREGFKVPVGYYFCWSCKQAGTWNKLASTLSLEPLVETDNPNIENNLGAIQWEEEYQQPDESMMFPFEDDWVRNDGVVKLKTLETFKAKLYMKIVNLYGEYESRRKLWLPAYENDELMGHVEARLDPEDLDPDPKYMNAPGVWSSQYWLGFDTVSNNFNEDYCCLVEGPADLLMMYQRHIPALPLLGVTSWSNTKRAALTVRFQDVIIIGDGDNAGDTMYRTLRTSLIDHCNVHRIKLPEGEDPASLNKVQYEDLRKVIKRKLKGVTK